MGSLNCMYTFNGFVTTNKHSRSAGYTFECKTVSDCNHSYISDTQTHINLYQQQTLNNDNSQII